jgi:hypothetical protein
MALAKLRAREEAGAWTGDFSAIRKRKRSQSGGRVKEGEFGWKGLDMENNLLRELGFISLN